MSRGANIVNVSDRAKDKRTVGYPLPQKKLPVSKESGKKQLGGGGDKTLLIVQKYGILPIFLNLGHHLTFIIYLDNRVLSKSSI